MDGCPTCSHTLAMLTATRAMRYFHCDRCGTIVTKTHRDQVREVYRPKLVDRCGAFSAILHTELKGLGKIGHDLLDSLRQHWRIIGESINRPEDRPS